MDDFLFMAWEQHAGAIVMIGSYSERGMTKIDRYIPPCMDSKCRTVTTMDEETDKSADHQAESADMEFPADVPFSQLMFESRSGMISEDGVLHTRTMNVRCVRETFYKDVGVLERCLSLWPTDAEEEDARSLRHYHLCSWPDHDVPSTTKPIRIFIRRLFTIQQQAYAEDSVPHPLIVHCSAGIGRTGVFCVSHWLLHMFVERRDTLTPSTEVNIYDIVDRFRSCRPGMVQTGQQYGFCYQVVADEARDLGIIPATPQNHPGRNREASDQHEPSSKGFPGCSVC